MLTSTENGKVLLKTLSTICTWGSKSKARFNIGLLLISAITGIVFYCFIDYSFDSINKKSTLNANIIQTKAIENRISLNIDYIDICIDATSEKLKKLYCEKSIELYKNNMQRNTSSDYDEILYFKAYKAMKVTLKNTLRERELKTLILKNDKGWFEIAIEMIPRGYSSIIIFIITVMILAAPILLYVLGTTYKYRKSKKEETSLEYYP
ncbi:hypothetical protein C0W42_21520 [Photobacterium kishitanii]|uniref:hypothetical protein n=1 Tax=Photobacterium kishitanii TaxID=318456 RepID=UPI000D15DA53|nr:hypothetical protein [Photobacterium kishitanii]PSU85245.1 hypothetical protein C0W42_21520 [Photobacterium kishitanii]